MLLFRHLTKSIKFQSCCKLVQWNDYTEPIIPHNNASPRTEDGDNEGDDDDDDDDNDDNDEEEENDSFTSSNQLGEVTTATQPEPVFRRRKKRSVAAESVENIVELMVAIDYEMVRFHGPGSHNYVLTLMGIVNKIFKDKSIGNRLHITVVNIIELSDRDVTLSSNRRTAEPGTLNDTFNDFCQWQHSQYVSDDLSPNHYDCALHLTRQNLKCEMESGKCIHKLGLADKGMMCRSRCCAVVRDNGLTTAFTIAHELGHTFNMPHDSDRLCTPYIPNGTVTRVMSTQLGSNTHPWKWSACSRHFLTEFLETGNGFCLHDDPFSDYLQDYPTHAQQLPGETYSKDKQCEVTWGKGFRSDMNKTNCSMLWCCEMNNIRGCISIGMPPAEGTPCGDSHWCQQGECVPVNREALKPVDGGWGPWQPFGECSRSCGGGIKHAYRNCDSPSPKNGGKFCLGRRVNYQSCNIKECPIGTMDFRAEQCAKHNGNAFGLNYLPRDVRWVPYHYSSPERKNAVCQSLYCRAEGTGHYYDLQNKVIDGTTCGTNTYDMCVNGICTKAGCDHVLNSNGVLDSCGVCGGDNSTCKKVYKNYAPSRIKFGYNYVAIIPAGASNINIQLRPLQHQEGENHLALVDSATGQYVLNGNWSITRYYKEINYEGVTISYTGSNISVERINTSEPLRKDLSLEVLGMRKLIPPEITCEYTVPISPQNYFSWQVAEKWTPCNKVCEGKKHKIIRCIRRDTNNQVSDESCVGLPKPKAEIEDCNEHCVLRWNVISQSECSSLCGVGYRNVTFGCLQVFNDNIYYKIPNKQLPPIECQHIQKPSEKQSCYGNCDTYHWKYGEWRSCNVSCGNGIQTREATCVDEFQRIVEDAKCANSEKIVENVCILQKCPLWSTSEWSRCSVTCGLGHRSRNVRCQQGNQIVGSYLCDSNKKPAHVEQCQMPACTTPVPKTTEVPLPLWTAGAWSDCSVSCGIGYRTRMVRCNRADQNLCSDTSDKPATQQTCFLPDCSTTTTQSNEIIPQHYNSFFPPALFKWVPEDWQPCSTSCGIGEKTRVVRCYSMRSKSFVDSFYCNRRDMPKSSESCSLPPCPVPLAEWKTTEWSQCSSSCGYGISVRNVWCEMNSVQVEENYCIRFTKPDKTVPCDNTKNCQSTAADAYSSTIAITTASLKASTSAQTSLPEPLPPTFTFNRSVWRPGKWGECSRSCGSGWKIRPVVCYDENGSEASDCDISSRPLTSMTCNVEPCENLMARRQMPKQIYRWTISDWTPCSVTCGIGVQKRTVQCERVLASATQFDPEKSIVSDEYCSEISQPLVTLQQECKLNYCSDDYIWVPEAWSECNAPCGGKGKQKRKLACFHYSGRKVKKTHCRFKHRPIRRRHCTLYKCEPSSCEEVKRKFKLYVDREYPLNILGRNISIYCHRMWSDSPAEYLTLPINSDNENYSEFFAKSTTSSTSNVKGCFEPVESYANAKRSCPCMKESTFKSGKTSFQKLRLNITTLEVNTHDFTFTRQIYGSAVPFGEAADCYSMLSCAGGSFSVNLKGTGLRISSSTSWTKTGVNASMEIYPSNENRKVVAKCAGYCAACKPARSSLKLDILPP
ncbi:A disintegrin and metalloproteinase with thrombospondin motifs 9-like isoform X2 [Planococcus citri]|uniref:A disintegrin and metalloproteinase with thrombospondin motifs 9-like isoform X2 n=1 Tax=Planococcus citri TaxID=170843 RepID=UPI0031F75743